MIIKRNRIKEIDAPLRLALRPKQAAKAVDIGQRKRLGLNEYIVHESGCHPSWKWLV